MTNAERKQFSDRLRLIAQSVTKETDAEAALQKARDVIDETLATVKKRATAPAPRPEPRMEREGFDRQEPEAPAKTTRSKGKAAG